MPLHRWKLENDKGEGIAFALAFLEFIQQAEIATDGVLKTFHEISKWQSVYSRPLEISLSPNYGYINIWQENKVIQIDFSRGWPCEIAIMRRDECEVYLASQSGDGSCPALRAYLIYFEEIHLYLNSKFVQLDAKIGNLHD